MDDIIIGEGGTLEEFFVYVKATKEEANKKDGLFRILKEANTEAQKFGKENRLVKFWRKGRKDEILIAWTEIDGEQHAVVPFQARRKHDKVRGGN